MGLGKILGVLLICMVLSAVLCILCRKTFKGQSPVVVFITWLIFAVFPTLAVTAVWYGILLIMGKVA